jgi:DNA-binding transcriptional MocR family regulator
MANGGYDHHLRRLRAAFATQVQRTSEAVAEHFPAGCRITQPAGGFVLWVEMPAAVDAVRLFELARDACIAVAPGPMFTNTGRFRNFMRLNCGNVWSSQIERAIMRLGEICRRLADA